MEVLLATMGFVAAGGSETYLLTVAEQLQRLGHEVTIYALETGPFADFARERGNRVLCGHSELPRKCHVALVQDGVVAYELAERYPEMPQVFRGASDLHDLQLPPSLPGITSAVVALSERVSARVRATPTAPSVVRLRQPVDTERFVPGAPIAKRPRRALLLSNYLRGDRRELIVSALAESDIECVQIGVPGSPSFEPEQTIWNVDIVVAKGRAALEAMACARAVFVYDAFGCDGWVTPERYEAMEADNFAGNANDAVLSPEWLSSELRAYRPEMGPANRDLIVRHHGARRHAQQLSELLGSVAAPSFSDDAPLRELARMVRLQWQADQRAGGFERAHALAQARVSTLESSHKELQRQHDELEREHTDLTRRYAELAAQRRWLPTSLRRARLAIRAGRLADRLRITRTERG